MPLPLGADEAGLLERLFDELERQLDVAGMGVKRCKMLDATPIETAAAAKPPRARALGGMGMRLSFVWAFLLATGVTASGCATAGGPSGDALPGGSHYVAMGSSYAAGVGIEPIQPTSGRCGRSQQNYPTLLANRLALKLDDQTCSGATTSNVLSAWEELPAQVNAVRPDTRLVTITIGGNDVGFVGSLYVASCGRGGVMVMSGRTVPCPAFKAPTDTDYEHLESNLREIVRQIRSRSNRARVIFVQYISIVPDHACLGAELDSDKVEALRLIASRLAEVTDRAAQLENAEVLEANRLSTDHTPCDAEPWSAGMNSPPGSGARWHPNRAGHAAIAAALATRLQN